MRGSCPPIYNARSWQALLNFVVLFANNICFKWIAKKITNVVCFNRCFKTLLFDT